MAPLCSVVGGRATHARFFPLARRARGIFLSQRTPCCNKILLRHTTMAMATN